MLSWLVLVVISMFIGWLYGEKEVQEKQRGLHSTTDWAAAVTKWRLDSVSIFSTGSFIFFIAAIGCAVVNNIWVIVVLGLSAVYVWGCWTAQTVSRPARWKSWRPVVEVPGWLLRQQRILETWLQHLESATDQDDEVKADVRKRLKEMQLDIRAVWAEAVLETFAEPHSILAAQVEILRESPQGHAQVRAALLEWEERFTEVEWCADATQEKVSAARRWLAESLEVVAHARRGEQRLCTQAVLDELGCETAARQELNQYLVQ